MAFYIDATSILDGFATHLTVYPKLKGKRIAGEWVKQSDNPIEADEPFIPSGFKSENSVQALFDSAMFEQYDAIWFSKLKVPVLSTVEHNGKKYVVQKLDDYTDYSNVTQYYLMANSKDEQNIRLSTTEQHFN